MKRSHNPKKRMLLMTAVVFMIAVALCFATLTVFAAVLPSGENLTNYQVSISGRLNLRFIYSSLGDADAFKADVYAPGESTPSCTYTYPVDKISETKTVSVPLAPSEMSYTVKVYPVRMSGGKVISHGAEKSYSVVKYANAVMSQRDDYDDIMRALLNWGGFARTYFDNTTTGLANEGVFTKGTNPQSAVTSVSYPQRDQVQTGSGFANPELNLALKRDDIALHVYFNYSGGNKLTATVKRDGISETATGIDSVGNGRYRVRLENLNVTLFDDIYTVNVSDGSSTFRAQISVLEYLNAMVTGTSYTDAQRSTARTLYQFYQLVTGNTGAESCSHAGADPKRNSDYYYVPSNIEGHSLYKCSHCFSELGHGTIGDGVELYIPAESLKYSTASSTAAFTLSSDSDGTEYTRIDGITSKNVNVNLMTTAGDGAVTGKYLVLKLRYGSNGLSQTTLAITANTTPSGTSVTNTVKVSEDNAWHVIVIDLSKGGTLTAGSDGKYHVNSLQITPLVPGGTFSYFTSIKATHYVDLAYIAMCDDVSDIKGVVKESTYEWSTSSSASCIRDTATNACQVSSVTETMTESGTDKIFTYGCTSCNNINYKKVISSSAKYISPSMMKNVQKIANSTTEYNKLSATTQFQMSNMAIKADADGTPYFTTMVQTGQNVAQLLWMRTGYAQEQYTTDLGNVNYLVLKVRVNEPTQKFSINLRTEGTDASKDYSLPLSEAPANEWGVYVIDLEKIFTTAFTEGQAINQFYLQFDSFAETTVIDIAYMAFVDGGLSELDSLIDEKTALFLTGSRTDVVDLKEGCTQGHKYVMSTATNFYVSTCQICGHAENYGGVSTADALKFLPAHMLESTASKSGTMDITTMTEDGQEFARYSNFKPNSSHWYGINYFSGGTVSGQYLIIKLRVPDNGLGSVRFDVFSNTANITANGLTQEGQTCIKVSEDNRWHTIVVDLKARSLDPAKTWPDNSEGYVFRHFSIRPFADMQTKAEADDYIDIAFMATCDELKDIPNILKNEVAYELSDSETSYKLYNKNNTLHTCTASSDSVELTTNPRGDKIYTYICECGHVASTRTVGASVNFFMDALDNAAHLVNDKLFLGQKPLVLAQDSAVPYVTGSNRQMIWCRSQKDLHSGERSTQTDTAFDIGDAKYLAIRVRTDVQGRAFDLSYSTEGSNSPTAVADANTDFTKYKYAIDGSANEIGKTYTTASAFGGIKIKMTETEANEWITYVIDLSQVLGANHKKADGADSYVVDSLYWTFGEDFESGHIDLDFIAFLENFADLGALTQDRSAYKIIAKDGSGVFVDPVSGMCSEQHTEKVISIKNPDSSTTYTLGCEKCGTARQDVKPLTIPASTNYITDLNTMTAFQFDITLEYDSVAGVFYNRFTTQSGKTGGHMNLTGGTGSGSATKNSYEPGRYVVMKYRVNGDVGTYINWYVKDMSATWGTQRQNTNFPGEWVIAVYDMNGRDGWYTENSQLYFQGTSGGGAVTTDIAYLATVDTLDELEALIGHEESYMWCGTGAFGSVGQVKHFGSAYCSDANNDGKCDICGSATVIYDNGGNIDDSGNKFELGAFALTDRVVNEFAAVNVSAEQLLQMLEDKTADAGTVYRVTEPIAIRSDTNYYGNLCQIIAEGGIIIEGVNNSVIKGIVMSGNVTIKNSKNITLYNVDIDSVGTAVSIDAASSDITIDSSVITASMIAVNSNASNVTVYNSYLSAESGVISTGNDLAVQNNNIDADKLGISSSGEYCIVKNNTLLMSKTGEGIRFTDGSSNGLIALNIVKDAQKSITVREGFNCVVILNSAINVSGSNNKNLYVVDNYLGGLITLTGNKYLLADLNRFVSDGKDHTVYNNNNSDYNGDNLHDVDARVEYGANEELLPHTNKDLFVGMERLVNVRDESYAASYTFAAYMKNMSRNGDVVIIPPGAYAVDNQIQLQAEHSNTTIYAYGVYQEKTVSKTGDGNLNFTSSKSTIGDLMGNIFNIDGGESIHVHGLAFGYDFQSSGQAYILEKIGVDTVRIVANAGYLQAFAAVDSNTFSDGLSATHGDEMYPFTNNVDHVFLTHPNGEYIDEDGTMLMRVRSQSVFNELRVGDIFGCRLAGDNSQTVYLGGTDLLLKDTVIYGYSAALALVSGGDSTNVRLERHHNTAHSSFVIDEATYNKYKALEVKYGLNADGADASVNGAQGLEVYIDAEGRYRGGLPRYGSVDGTHISSAKQGTSATSTIFENMVDDASNQRSSSARIAGFVNNGDGTTTIYYKGSLARTYYGINAAKGQATASPSNTRALSAGDTIFAYAMNGHTFVEAEVLSAGAVTSNPAGCHITHTDSDSNCICDGCGVALHYDFVTNGTAKVDPDCKCDVCGETIHTDYRSDYIFSGVAPKNEKLGITYYTGDNNCNSCGKKLMPNLDANGEPIRSNGMIVNAEDGAPIVTDMATYATLRLHSGGYYVLEYKVLATNGKSTTTPKEQYVITYSTPLRMATVKTEDVDFDAAIGYDLTDNDYFMDEKILCDNLSYNSCSFTFDNVLMQNYHSRGILMKATDATVKNCTFRNVGVTGVLMSIETTWGESTVPKNITIQGCLFDNTGLSHNQQGNKTYAPIAIQGLGDLSGELKGVSEYTLPCKNINIIGNKFTNTNNDYCITMSAAQDITIKDNIFEMRKLTDEFDAGKAIYIEGCMNIEVSGNKFYNNGGISNVIEGSIYKNIFGTDVEGKINTNSCGLTHTWTTTATTHSIAACEKCGTEAATNAPHKYIAKIINGEHVYICTCGVRSNEVPEHEYVEKLIDGKHAYVCKCGSVSSEIPPCTFVEKIEGGDHFYICRECGKISEESAHKQEYHARYNSDGSVTYYLGCKCGYGQKGTITVPAGTNFFSDLAVMGVYNHPTGGSTLTKFLYDEEADVVYNRVESASQTHFNITGGNTGGNFTTSTYELGRYLVVKYRTNNGSALILKPGSALHRGTLDNTTDAYKNYRGVNVGSNKSADWQVAVIDISGKAGYGADPANVSEIYMMFMANYADIAYVAVVDSLDEMRVLVTDEIYAYHGTSFTNTPTLKYTENDKCVSGCTLDSNSYHATSESGDRIYSYTCSECGNKISTYNIPSSVFMYMSADTLNTINTSRSNFEEKLHPNTHYSMRDTTGVGYDPVEDTSFFTYGHYTPTHQTATQIIWCRTTSASKGEKNPTDIGNSRYLVIKMRTQYAQKMYFLLGTTATATNSTVILPFSVAEDSSDWTTYVIDLKAVLGTSYAKDSTTGTYVLDNLYIQTANTANDTMKNDIAYIAFAEQGDSNEWSEVAKLIGDDKTVVVTGTSGNSSSAYQADPATGNRK